MNGWVKARWMNEWMDGYRVDATALLWFRLADAAAGERTDGDCLWLVETRLLEGGTHDHHSGGACFTHDCCWGGG